MARILIVEDEPLIAMMLEDWLTELGHEPLGPADSVDKALRFVDNTPLDAAIVDVNLQARRSDAVADLLKARNIPFAFATGDSTEAIDERFADTPTVSKPYDFDAIRHVADALTGSSQTKKGLNDWSG